MNNGPWANTILHVDMDAFFAAIEQLDHPEWRGLPLVVGSPPDKRGVVSTASYEARKFGIRSAMPSRTAGKLCPHAIFAPPRMERYVEVSRQLMTILQDFTPDVEGVSIDEAFLDLKSVLHLWPDIGTLGRTLKQRIHDKLSLTASVGIAANKFLAKIASDLQKPDGLTILPTDPAAIAAFLTPLPVGRLWGVGKVLEKQLLRAGITTIGDVQSREARFLIPMLGEAMTAHIKSLAEGIDDREVTLEWEEKSLSRETTFDEDCSDPAVIHQTLIELAELVGARLRRHEKKARTCHIKVRLGSFKTMTRQKALGEPTDSDREIVACTLALYSGLNEPLPIRLLGVGVSHLISRSEKPNVPAQEMLFPEKPPKGNKRRHGSLDQAIDRLRKTFGPKAVKRGNWKNSSLEI